MQGSSHFQHRRSPNADPETAKNYLDRMKAYIPAEVVAFYIFVNSQVIGIPLRVPGKPLAVDAQAMGNQQAPAVEPAMVITVNGYVAIATLVVGFILSILYARVRREGQRPAVEGAGDRHCDRLSGVELRHRWARLRGVEWDVVPSLAGLLMATFTGVSGFIVPIKKT